jgi:hypothetical protein
MGYHITIMRAQSNPILIEEVARAIGRMAGRLAFDSDAQPDPQVYEPGKDLESEIMLFEDGELWAKTPSSEFLALMIELAGLLGARVRGDELETYRTVEQTYSHPDDRELIAEAEAMSQRMLRQQRRRDWIARIATVSVLALLGLMYSAFAQASWHAALQQRLPQAGTVNSAEMHVTWAGQAHRLRQQGSPL